MWKPARALRVRPDDREWLETLVAGGKTPQRVVLRARIVLGAAGGQSNNGLAKELGISRPTLLRWRQRYVEAGVVGLLKDAPRPGRRKWIRPEQVEAIVNATLHTTPRDATQWSVRSLAQAQRVSPATVHRIWQAANLQPHRTKTFKLSRDPHFVRKLRDVVGLYMNPPAKALVLSVDEKSQIQALDRTQPILPLRPGLPARQTHDYTRHGTTTLFAALNVLEGHVIETCQPRHTHAEFLAFLDKIDRQTSRTRAIHLILDNYGTHKHPTVKTWMVEHPRFHFHFTPTGASWLNLVERFFAEITRKRIRRGTFRSVSALIAAIRAYVREHNKDPRPFIWTATAAAILRKIKHCKQCVRDGTLVERNHSGELEPTKSYEAVFAVIRARAPIDRGHGLAAPSESGLKGDACTTTFVAPPSRDRGRTATSAAGREGRDRRPQCASHPRRHRQDAQAGLSGGRFDPMGPELITLAAAP